MTPFSTNDIYELLKKEILTFQSPPGTAIGEIETSKRFGVSRTPTRDALKRLELDNLINIVPQKGSFVAPINLVQIIDFIYMREQIEIGIATDAMKTIDSYSLKQLELSLIKQRSIISNPTMTMLTKAHEFYTLDNEFHRIIFKSINKDTIWDYFSKMMPDYTRFRAMSAEMHTEESLLELYEHHKLILKCLIDNDDSKLREFYHIHINTGVDAISRLLQYKEGFFI